MCDEQDVCTKKWIRCVLATNVFLCIGLMWLRLSIATTRKQRLFNACSGVISDSCCEQCGWAAAPFTGSMSYGNGNRRGRRGGGRRFGDGSRWDAEAGSSGGGYQRNSEWDSKEDRGRRGGGGQGKHPPHLKGRDIGLWYAKFGGIGRSEAERNSVSSRLSVVELKSLQFMSSLYFNFFWFVIVSVCTFVLTLDLLQKNYANCS